MGYNYTEYDKSANPYDTKYKILPVGKKPYKPEKNRYIPQAKNHVFDNSPALNTNLGVHKRPNAKEFGRWSELAKKLDKYD
jgi:hypothetical protein